jgi:polyisoprenyl-phosphate glycosyltransferase
MDALFERVLSVLDGYPKEATELLCVDDGSTDGTWSKIMEQSHKDSRVVGIKLSRNFGHQHALSCGLDYASGARILIIDADLQDPPELLPEMMHRMDAGADVVYGTRLLRQGESRFKTYSARMFYKTLSMFSDTYIPENTGDFRLLNRRVADALKNLPERVRFQRGLISWLGYTQVALEYKREARVAGKTHYTLRRMVRFAGVGIVSFSSRPLRFCIWLGMSMVGVSSILLAYVVFSYMVLGTVRGWASIIAIFLVFQALQFFAVGILGGYIGIIFHEVKRRPLYLVAEATQTLKNPHP